MTENKKIGRYIIESMLGEGAMGSVFRAQDPFIKRTVAIKTVKLERTRSKGDNQEFYERFIREAEISGRLNHPNIVSIFDVGEQDSMPYIAMEYVEGETLNDFCNDTPRPNFELRVRIMGQVASALDYAHAQGVVHRDLKPANIMVMKDGTAKIMDFGIAKMNDSNLTQTGVFLGTPSYSSPEQIKEGVVDFRSDIFTFGILCHEVLCGNSPFSGSTINSILYKIANDPPVFPDNMGSLPIDQLAWRQVFGRVLNKNPNQRYQTATEFINAVMGSMKLSEKTVREFREDLNETIRDPDLQRKMAMGKELQRSEFERSRAGTRAAKDLEKPGKRSSIPLLLLLLVLFAGIAGAWQMGYINLDPYVAKLTTFLDGMEKPDEVEPDPVPEVTLVEHQFTIESTPTGAAVSVNGEAKGVTPLPWSWVGKDGDTLNLTLAMDGYGSMEQILTWPQILSEERVDFKLDVEAVSHSIESQPTGAKVTINGRDRGKTPLNAELIPGQIYDVKVSLAGYFSKEIKFEEGKSSPDALSFRLKKIPPPGTVEVQTEMDDLQITIGGKTTRGNKVQIKGGTHKVRLRSQKYFYNETLEKVEVEAGKTLTLETPPVITIPKIDFVGGYVKVRIDGQFVKNHKGEADTTPLVNLKIAVGSHHFEFIDVEDQVVAQKKHEVLNSEQHLVFTFDDKDNNP